MKTDVLLNLQSATVRGVRRRVLSPRVAPRRFFVAEESRHGWDVLADAGGYMRLAELAAVAASDPGCLVYMPPGIDRPKRDSPFEARSRVAMLFVHHSAHFRGSDWKELRRRLGPARPARRALRLRCEPNDDGFFQWGRGDEANPLDVASHAETLVMAGSAQTFLVLARMLRGLAQGPRYDHIHFMDTVKMRRRGDLCRGAPTPDVICSVNTHWQPEEELGVRFDYRWIYPGVGLHAGMSVEQTIEAEGEFGWEPYQRRDAALVMRRLVY